MASKRARIVTLLAGCVVAVSLLPMSANAAICIMEAQHANGKKFAYQGPWRWQYGKISKLDLEGVLYASTQSRDTNTIIALATLACGLTAIAISNSPDMELTGFKVGDSGQYRQFGKIGAIDKETGTLVGESYKVHSQEALQRITEDSFENLGIPLNRAELRERLPSNCKDMLGGPKDIMKCVGSRDLEITIGDESKPLSYFVPGLGS